MLNLMYEDDKLIYLWICLLKLIKINKFSKKKYSVLLHTVQMVTNQFDDPWIPTTQ